MKIIVINIAALIITSLSFAAECSGPTPPPSTSNSPPATCVCRIDPGTQLPTCQWISSAN